MRAPATGCREFEIKSDALYSDPHCYRTEFQIRKGPAGELIIERFFEDGAGLPVTGKIPYLGEAQIRRVHAEGEVQQARMPDEPRPFLIPKRVTTTFEADKGSIVVTNVYTLVPAARK